MTTFKKLSAIALFSAFLTACDKPASQAKVETSASQVQQSEPMVEQKTEKLLNTGAEDYKTFRHWQHEQEQAIDKAITAEVEKLGNKAQDPHQLREAMNRALLSQVEQIKQSAETLIINDPEVKLLKEKSIEALTLGAEMMVEGEKVAQNPTEETHKAFGELQAKLDNIAQEGKALENELMKKYEAQPEQAVENTSETTK